jgi:hypothetical protein
LTQHRTGHERTEAPIMLTEFGGIAFAAADRSDGVGETWGYVRAETLAVRLDRHPSVGISDAVEPEPSTRKR